MLDPAMASPGIRGSPESQNRPEFMKKAWTRRDESTGIERNGNGREDELGHVFFIRTAHRISMPNISSSLTFFISRNSIISK